MKNLKSVLAALAFVFAFTAAFALKADLTPHWKKLSNGQGNCVSTALPPGCQVGSGTACQIVEAGGTYNYFQFAGCVTPLVRVP